MKIKNYGKVAISSLEIAEITGKRHDNILRDIEVQLTEILGEKALLKFEESYINSNNREFKCYNLSKIEALIVVSGYDAKLRASIIYRLEELEKKSTQKLENQTFTNTILYDNYSKAITEVHKAKLELSNTKHQLTKERLKNTRKELKLANEKIVYLFEKLKESEYKLTTNESEINMLSSTVKKLHKELDKK